MYRGSSSTRNTHQANGSARAYSIHPIIFCLIGIAGFHPVILVFAAERCVPPAATRVVSVQGNVTWSIAGSAALEPAKLNDMLCVGDIVRVGTKSRAVLRLPNETTIPLDQNTVFQLKQPISEKEPTLIELIQGAIHVITRTPKPFKVNTPYMNAAVEGTEFYVGVDAEEARVAVIEGKVNVSNEQGALLLTDNEAAIAKKGQAPQKTLTIKPRDAVQWALYYPPLFDPRSRPGAENLSASYELYSQGKITKAIESLNAIPETERNGDYYTYRAGLLLLVGRADEADPDIETALKENAINTDALSLTAIIAIVQNDKVRALELANQAVNIDHQSASARIALSYALQANFKIEDALKAAREATERDANNALAWARVAELELSIPNYDKSKEAAERAVKLNPNLARTQSVLGFANLTRIDINAAKESFSKAIEFDQADPLPRLGLGLAKIREGSLAEGREEIETAAGLDLENSLIRTYLGKVYHEEKRNDLAGTQFELAKERDPKDPTAYFYDAIRKQSTNRPVEALQDLEQSIILNDNRAVYRSTLLLDDDVAARNTSLARTYRDLGFEQLAVSESLKSITTNPIEYSAHRFLADAYVSRPRHEIARVSELLQSQLLQPISIGPVQPQSVESNIRILDGGGPTYASPAEFNPLFNSDRLSAYGVGIVGANRTLGKELVIHGVRRRASFSIGGFHFRSDGFRENNDIRQNLYNLFLQLALTSRTSAQIELRSSDTEQGDLASKFALENFSGDLRSSETIKIARIGLHHSLRPGSDLVASMSYKDARFSIAEPSTFTDSDSKETGYLGELQHLFHSQPFNLISGIGHFASDRTDNITFGPGIVVPFDGKVRHSNAYAYSQLKYWRPLNLTVGLTSESFLDEGFIKRNQLNPKLGVIWTPSANWTFRAAGFRALKRALVANQTIEPSQVAGFNQFFDDQNGTISRRIGIGIDHRFAPTLYGGVEASHRYLRVPITFASGTSDVSWKEKSHRAYLYATPLKWLALRAEYQYEEFERGGETPVNGFSMLKTRRFPLGLELFPSEKLALKLEPTYFRQDGIFQDATFTLGPGEDRFWVVDGSIEYRLPKRLGVFTLTAKNLLDRTFMLHQDINPTISTQPRVAPKRSFFAKFSLTLP